MTREEIIEYAEAKKAELDERMSRPESMYGAYAMYSSELEFTSAAISALRAQQEQESNEPLTLDELLQMKGKPVWAIDGTGTATYILIDAFGNGIDADSGCWDVDYYGLAEYKCEKFTLHRMGWLAYRHQLKNTTEG